MLKINTSPLRLVGIRELDCSSSNMYGIVLEDSSMQSRVASLELSKLEICRIY